MKRFFFPTILILLLTNCSKPKEQRTTEVYSPILKPLNEPLEFDQINTEHIQYACKSVQEVCVRMQQEILDIPDNRRTFENTMKKRDMLASKAMELIAVLGLMAHVHPEDDIRNISSKEWLKLRSFMDSLLFTDDMYYAVKRYGLSSESQTLPASKKRYVQKRLILYQNRGAGLSKEVRDRIKEINDSIAYLGNKFVSTIEDPQYIDLTADELEGLSEDFKKSNSYKNGVYQVELSDPVSAIFLRDATSENARKKYYLALNSMHTAGNKFVLEDLLDKRKRSARLLGYEDYAEYQLSSTSISSSDNVWQFLYSLETKIRPMAIENYQELMDMKAQTSTGEKPIQVNAWDNAFHKNQLLKKKYDVDINKLSEYFELYATLKGIFSIIEELFDVSFEKVSLPKWHQDVISYEIRQNGEFIGRFYLDLFSRETKQLGTYVWPISYTEQLPSGRRKSSAVIISDYLRPTEGRPTLLSHEDVLRLFWNMGFIIQQSFDESGLVFQNSYFASMDFGYSIASMFQNWAWEYEAVSRFARHYHTGDTLSLERFNKLAGSKNVNAALDVHEQILYSMTALQLYDHYKPAAEISLADQIKSVTGPYAIFPEMSGTNFEYGFYHLYPLGAKYFNYIWAEAYGKEMFAPFKKNGLMDQKSGKRFRAVILRKGCSEDEYKMIKEFLGKPPTIDAYISSLKLRTDSK